MPFELPPPDPFDHHSLDNVANFIERLTDCVRNEGPAPSRKTKRDLRVLHELMASFQPINASSGPGT